MWVPATVRDSTSQVKRAAAPCSSGGAPPVSGHQIAREELVRAMTTAREGLGEIGLAIGQDVDGERAARVDRGDER